MAEDKDKVDVDAPVPDVMDRMLKRVRTACFQVGQRVRIKPDRHARFVDDKGTVVSAGDNSCYVAMDSYVQAGDPDPFRFEAEDVIPIYENYDADEPAPYIEKLTSEYAVVSAFTEHGAHLAKKPAENKTHYEFIWEPDANAGIWYTVHAQPEPEGKWEVWAEGTKMFVSSNDYEFEDTFDVRKAWYIPAGTAQEYLPDIVYAILSAIGEYKGPTMPPNEAYDRDVDENAKLDVRAAKIVNCLLDSHKQQRLDLSAPPLDTADDEPVPDENPEYYNWPIPVKRRVGGFRYDFDEKHWPKDRFMPEPGTRAVQQLVQPKQADLGL